MCIQFIQTAEPHYRKYRKEGGGKVGTWEYMTEELNSKKIYLLRVQQVARYTRNFKNKIALSCESPVSQEKLHLCASVLTFLCLCHYPIPRFKDKISKLGSPSPTHFSQSQTICLA